MISRNWPHKAGFAFRRATIGCVANVAARAQRLSGLAVRLRDDRGNAEGRNMVRRRRLVRIRRGSTALEFAFILPVFLTFVFGLMAVGHYRMSADLLKGACRNAARYGALQNVTTTMAEQRFRDTVAPGMNANLVTLYVKDLGVADASGSAMPSTSSEYNALPDIELSGAPSRRLFAVYAEVNYNNIAIIPMNWIPWANNLKLSSQVFTRHE